MQTTDRLTVRAALLWIVCLALLSVGARNFEEGLSGDAPLYASIARNIARSGEWFLLHGNVPDFIPYAEHPHLGFWILAAVFKVLPAEDWAARLVGHVFYVAFLFTFFLFVRKRSSEKTAVGAVLLLWIWFRFSNFFSNVYLDPGALFFASLSCFVLDEALERGRTVYAVLSGVLLALSALYKGVTVVAFFPVLVLIVLTRPTRRWLAFPLLIGGFALVVAGYFILLQQSQVPDFLSRYWDRQLTGRFLPAWQWSGLWDGRFWGGLFRDTYWLLPLGLLSLRQMRKLFFPWTLFLTFVVLYAPTARAGAQYWIWILPWVAWLVSDAVFSTPKWDTRWVARGSAVFALVAVAILQYVPVRTHRVTSPSETRDILEAKRLYDVRTLIADLDPPLNFMGTSPFAWYADVDVQYPDPLNVPPATKGTCYLLKSRNDGKEAELRAANWCVLKPYEGRSLWVACSVL